MASFLNTQKDIILFDGVCNFCNSYINYTIRHDRVNRFLFAPLDGETALKLSQQHRVNFNKFDSIIVISGNRFFSKSEAVLHILKNLGTWWSPIINVAYLVPGCIRNQLYQKFARNRYALFGQADHCMVPTADVRSKFLT
ncbi:thiol-disulfide oxidoreductase DCC family protein [uncultured Pedobacter sp.]|uniref:thiol-disulfide oxidoreductase DCC family protein n=1 Tax=uncultured Pedobacter sp. TaxID=246139 RepID=UPI0025D24E0B|nr:DCC1-like thiol-disulfide oxidoreductase family protein [uncultured Pedobacter sp.]